MKVRRSLAVFALCALVVLVSATLFLPSMTVQSEGGVQEGEEAPPFSVRTLENRVATLNDYQEGALILDFFASWCHVCGDTTSELNQVRENFSRENLAVLSIESDPAVPIENVRSFKSVHGGNWSFAKAPGVAEKYGVDGYPTILVVDLRGHVAFRSEGVVPPHVLNGFVSGLLETQKSPETGPESQSGEDPLTALSLVSFVTGAAVGATVGALAGYLAGGKRDIFGYRVMLRDTE